MHWTYGESDPALMLFTAARERFGLHLPDGARVLELGCAETTFLERLKRQNPSFELYGVDVRRDRDADGWTFLQRSACSPSLWIGSPKFDAIIMLGALEHFGLGFYGDPVDDEGDSNTMRNVAWMLKVGGWVYFDVPYQPSGFRVSENRHFRMYDDQAIADRLIHPAARLREQARAYSEPEPTAGVWVERPGCDRVPYWFAASVSVKVTP